jgi:hypothetical protein
MLFDRSQQFGLQQSRVGNANDSLDSAFNHLLQVIFKLGAAIFDIKQDGQVI